MRILLLMLLCIMGAQSYAQTEAMIARDTVISFDSATSYTYSQLEIQFPNDTSEAGVLTEFSKWKLFYEGRIALDAPAGENMFNALNDATHYFLSNQNDYCPGEGYTGDWDCLGPFNDYYGVTEFQGRIESVWVHPDSIGIILAGAQTGGLWKTTDTGHTWVNITDPTSGNAIIPGTMGAPEIAVDPLNFDTIYIAAQVDVSTTLRTSGNYKRGGYSLGLAFTPDGGDTWILDTNFASVNQHNIGNTLDKFFIAKIGFMPDTDMLFAIANNKVLLKPDAASAWQNITSSSFPTGYEFTDFEFSSASAGKVVFSTNAQNNDTSYLWIYDVATTSWDSFGITLPSPLTQDNTTAIVDITIDGNDLVYMNLTAQPAIVISPTESVTRHVLARTPINTLSLTFIDTSISLGLEFIEASKVNDSIIYATVHDGSNSFYKSTNQGGSFSSIQGNTHADGRFLSIYHADTGADGLQDIIIGGSDGGVVMKKAGSYNFQSITGSGLAVTQFFGMANTEADERLIAAGAQDNGGFSYISGRTSPWWKESLAVGDGYLSKFANNGVLEAYVEGNPMRRINHFIFNNNNTVSVGSAGNPVDFGNNSCQYCEQNTHQRELYFDPDNQVYVGYLRNWNKGLNSGSWTTTFTEDPIDYIRTGKFILKEPNKDTAYVSYRKVLGGDTSGFERGRLYFSLRANNISDRQLHWKKLNHEQLRWNRVNDIVTQPGNMKRLWVALGDVNFGLINTSPNSMVARILYNDNYGDSASWDMVTYSKGLPAVPVNCIVYQEGTDDRLFCGTDVGVFVWNKEDMQWYCFNTGMPPCIVTKLEFNYCAGKLRASTYGRGIWETPLYANPSEYVRPIATKIIDNNTTWSTSQYLLSSVQVDSGATLTITGSGTTVFMPKLGEINVKPGGKLVVDSATITNGCEGCMWSGIRAEGNSSQPQSASKQATVELTAATIEHAIIGVANHRSDDTNSLYTGGIIEAEYTNFFNCARAIELERYIYNPSWSVVYKNYRARFTKCLFEVNDDFKGSTAYPFRSHVYMDNVNAIVFKGCEFYNRISSGAYQGDGDAIRAIEAGFTVRAYCNPAIYPCTYERGKFKGFTNGIFVGRTLTGLTGYTVDRCDFDSCGVGIKVNGTSIGVASRNYFSIGNGKMIGINEYTECHKNIGIWTEHAEKPTIESNEFEGVTHAGQHVDHENIGVLVDNNGFKDLLVYNNDFHDLDYGGLNRGDNSNAPTNGVKYECNSFEDNDYDIVISEHSVVSANSTQNIAVYQGSLQKSAGNEFLSSSSNNHFVNTTTINPTNTYYHSGSTTSPAINPTYGTLFYTHFTSNVNTCSDRYPSGTAGRDLPLGSGDLGSAKSGFSTGRIALNDKIDELNNLLDDGDTDALVDDINNSTQADTPALKTDLLSYSPYLTKTSLTALADAGLFSQAGLIDILEVNPEVLRDNDFLEYLEFNIPDPLSSTQIDYLITASDTPSVRSEKESEISYYEAQVADLGNLIVSHYIMDTTASDIDSIPVWLDSVGTLQAAYLKVQHYTGLGDYTTAQSILDDIPSSFSLTTEQETLHDLFDDTWTILKGAYDDDRTIYQLTSTELDDLDDIYNNSSSDGTLYKIVIDIVNNRPDEPIRMPCNFQPIPSTGLKQGRSDAGAQNDNVFGTQNKSIGKNNIVKAYPNPAKDHVTFEYQLGKGNSLDHVLNITSVSGRTVHNIPVKDRMGKLVWDTSLLPSGVYIYELKDGNRTIDVGKIVISK